MMDDKTPAQDHDGGGAQDRILTLDEAMDTLNPYEFREYLIEHPELENDFLNKVMDTVGPTVSMMADTVREAMQRGDAAKEYIREIAATQKAIVENLQRVVAKVSAYIAELPGDLPGVERLEATLDEIEDLKPLLDAETKKHKNHKGRTFDEVFNTLPPFMALRYLAVYDDAPLPDPDRANGEKPEEFQILEDLLQIRTAARARKKAEETKKKLPQIKGYGNPKNFLMPNSAFANALRGIDGKGELIGAGPVDIPVMNIGKPNEITIYAEAGIDEGYTLTTEKPYTAYNEAVLNGVVSLYVDRCNRGLSPIVTAADIYRTMNDMNPGASVSPAQRAAVTKSMTKLNNNWGKLDATDQIKKLKITDPDGNPIEGLSLRARLLEFRIIDVNISGTVQQAYLITNEPITYTHSKLTRQVISFPAALLDVKETRRVNSQVELLDVSISNTPARIAAKMYVVKRVEIMRKDEERAIEAHRKEVKKCAYENKKGTPSKPRPIRSHRKQSRIILFDTLFTAAEITNPSRKTEIKQYVFNVLDFLQAKGRITSWKARKNKNKAADAVEITI